MFEWIKSQNPDYIEQFGIKEFSPDNVPENCKEWTLKCLKDMAIYEQWQKDADINQNKEYFNNFLEKDASKIGKKMKELYCLL